MSELLAIGISHKTAPVEVRERLALPEAGRAGFLHELRATADVGYESPTAIQAATIPPLMAGTDVVGLAQTGTGKTAAFAIPILSKIDVTSKATQALVLAPTRELALQVAEAFSRYGAHLPQINLLPIYGGSSYGVHLAMIGRL